MPQRSFWAQQHEVKATFVFLLNPLNPGGPPRMRASFHDQEGTLVKETVLELAPTIAEDVFLDLVSDGFRAWMMTDAEHAVRTMRRGNRLWWEVAEEQALTR